MQTHASTTPIQLDPIVSVRERTLIAVVLTAFYCLYHPLAVITNDMPFYTPLTALDEAVPLVPEWIYLYAFVFLIAFIPAGFIESRNLFRKMALAYFVVQVTAFTVFIFFPVRMTLRPDSVAVDSFVTWGLQLCYYLDKPVNCCPSLHVALAFLGALCTRKADRALGNVCIVLAVGISLSTMFVKQHFVLDVIVGLALSTLAFHFIVGPVKTDTPQKETRLRGRKRAGVMLAIYCAAIAVLYSMYASGFAPWSAPS